MTTVYDVLMAALLRHIQRSVDIAAVRISGYSERIEERDYGDAYFCDQTVISVYYRIADNEERCWEFEGDLIHLLRLLEAVWST